VEQPRPGQIGTAIATILVVDDELDMRMLVKFVFELANDGLQVVGEASDGDEALTVWRSLDPPPVPDVVILDNRMPRLSGVEAAEQILAERPDQLIVLYSAFLDDEVTQEADRVGIHAVVPKSQIDTLPDVVRELVASR
jgi:DNA-binding NarL/FixJ family response regulator